MHNICMNECGNMHMHTLKKVYGICHVCVLYNNACISRYTKVRGHVHCFVPSYFTQNFIVTNSLEMRFC